MISPEGSDSTEDDGWENIGAAALRARNASRFIRPKDLELPNPIDVESETEAKDADLNQFTEVDGSEAVESGFNPFMEIDGSEASDLGLESLLKTKKKKKNRKY